MHWTPRQVSNTKHFCWSKHRSFNDLSGLLLGPNTDTLSDFCSLFLNFFRLIPKGGAWFGICGQRGNSNFHLYIIIISYTGCFLVACQFWDLYYEHLRSSCSRRRWAGSRVMGWIFFGTKVYHPWVGDMSGDDPTVCGTFPVLKVVSLSSFIHWVATKNSIMAVRHFDAWSS